MSPGRISILLPLMRPRLPTFWAATGPKVTGERTTPAIRFGQASVPARARRFAPTSSPPSNHPPRISHRMEGSLIQRVQPEYPPLAKQARIQGTVLLHAVIDREGKIEDLQVLGGHPLLVETALKAVQQWRYRPYYLDG